MRGNAAAVSWPEFFPYIQTHKENWINIRLRFNPWNTRQSIQEVSHLSAFLLCGTIIPSKRHWASLPIFCPPLFHPWLRFDNPYSYRLSMLSLKQSLSIVLSPYLLAQYSCHLKAQNVNLFPLTSLNVNFEF